MPRAVRNQFQLERDWKKRADQLRAEAETLPAGRAKDAVLKQARQLDTASQMSEWLKSSGLKAAS